MENKKKYTFTSQRLGFRNWESTDIEEMFQINTDEEVMEFFPGISTKEQTIDFVERMKNQFAHKGFCYLPLTNLKTENLSDL